MMSITQRISTNKRINEHIRSNQVYQRRDYFEVVFEGPDTSKYMKYIKEGMAKTYTVKVVDNRIYSHGRKGHLESILATRLVEGIDGGDDNFIEVIYPRDLIRKVN